MIALTRALLNPHGIYAVAALCLGVMLLYGLPVQAAAEPRGHVKLAARAINLADDNLFAEDAGDPARQAYLDARLGWQNNAGRWYWQIDYQVLYLDGDQLTASGPDPASAFDDDKRLFDLSDRFSDDATLAQHRLDRFSLGYRGEQLVVNLGRQAISWGNGVIFNPVDLFNPFDPVALDTEFKPGDDMLYSQLLFADGSDLQAVAVARRDDDGKATAEVASFALKYHAWRGPGEIDLLAGRHFDAAIAAVGGAIDFDHGLWRGDILLSEADDGPVASAVLNWSRSTTAWSRNLATTIEYFYSGFGIGDGDYAPPQLEANVDLIERINRGELFTLARNYLAASLSVEVDPLWLIDATLIANLDDGSRRLQLVSRHDPDPAMLLLLAADIPAGDQGSEYGGLPSAIGGRSLATEFGLSAQLAWYF